MENLRIFPAAAVIIALTASVYFVRDQRENEEIDYIRTRIIERPSASKLAKDSSSTAIGHGAGRVYLVEIGHDNKTQEVMVDARTGEIIGERNVLPLKVV